MLHLGCAVVLAINASQLQHREVGIDDKMRTTENRIAGALSVWGRLRRDVVFLISLATMIVYYWIAGGRIRKAYRRCQARREIYWVDEEPGETERRLR